MATRILTPAVLVACSAALSAQDYDITANYTKRTAMVPMRDGTRLHTQIFKPQDKSRCYPILLSRTPYGMRNYGPKIVRRRLGPSNRFAIAGYVFVYQDVRGQNGSEGDFEVLRPPRRNRADPRATDETTDAYDTISWLLENVNCNNGKVGMWGISYAAWQTVMAMADAHPNLLAVSPQASPSDMFLGDDIHHNGAFRLHYMFHWMSLMGSLRGDLTGKKGDRFRYGTNDLFAYHLANGPLSTVDDKIFCRKLPFWTRMMEHGTHDDFWRRRDPVRLLDDVRPAVLNVAGWFDAEDFRGPFAIYEKVEAKDSDNNNHLIVGPWRHGGWARDRGDSLGPAKFRVPTAKEYQRDIEFPFFEHHLRDNTSFDFGGVTVFETGGNRWHRLSRWPPADVVQVSLQLRPNGRAELKSSPRATQIGCGSDRGFDEFVSDPSDPVPFTAECGPRIDPGYMVEDQSFVANRKDVLSYTTEPLPRDLVLAGRARVRLFFATTGTDADWVVKLIDTHPDEKDREAVGYQIPLACEIFRSKFRKSFSKPVPLKPGTVTKLEFELPDRYHRFLAGHRIRVEIQSSWFPLYDRNPQTFTDIYRARESDFVKATHRVYRNQGAMTQLLLPVQPN
ncbi:MAG: CocE/NonD family hydrolase [Planctomycetota bacterium]